LVRAQGTGASPEEAAAAVLQELAP
jgi:hypothetical protein